MQKKMWQSWTHHLQKCTFSAFLLFYYYINNVQKEWISCSLIKLCFNLAGCNRAALFCNGRTKHIEKEESSLLWVGFQVWFPFFSCLLSALLLHCATNNLNSFHSCFWNVRWLKSWLLCFNGQMNYLKWTLRW